MAQVTGFSFTIHSDDLDGSFIEVRGYAEEDGTLVHVINQHGYMTRKEHLDCENEFFDWLSEGFTDTNRVRDQLSELFTNG